MALGSNYQNNNQNQNSMWEPSYYSRLRIKNPEQNLALTFTFWKGTLKVSITETGSSQEGRNNELAYIHLSPTKARILAEGVKRVSANSEGKEIYGVDTGTGETRGFIAIGREIGKPFLFIAKVNANGGYESSQRFDFNNNYNYLLGVHDLANLKCQKEYMNNIELDQFCGILEDYARFASGALGASFYDIGRYENAKLSNMVRSIGIKTGAIDPNKYGNGGGGRSNNSFFNNVGSEYEQPSSSAGNSSSGRSRYQNIDDLESELG